MVSIYKRKDGKKGWRMVIRIQGYPTICRHYERKQEAIDETKEIEHAIRHGTFKFDQKNHLQTFNQVVDRFISDGALQHHRSAADTLRHLNYWKDRLGCYALMHLTPDLIVKERQLLIETPSAKNKLRTPSTINRYFSSLSSVLSYATRQLRWISENPCINLIKLKENPSRDRILSLEEIDKLLMCCRESRSPYLYCVVLISLTSGARQGEILKLHWQHIDFDNRIAHLKETKNGRSRSIYLTDPVIEELRKIHQNRDPNKHLVFASKTPFGKVDIKKAWKEALKRAGITDYRRHDCAINFVLWQRPWVHLTCN